MTVMAALSAFCELDEMSPHKRADARQHVDGLSPTLPCAQSRGGAFRQEHGMAVSRPSGKEANGR